MPGISDFLAFCYLSFLAFLTIYFSPISIIVIIIIIMNYEDRAQVAGNKYKGVFVTNDIRGNGRNKLLVIGKTGVGKSSLCNIFTGHPHDAEIFPVSAAAVSCTQSTQFAETFFNADIEKPIRCNIAIFA